MEDGLTTGHTAGTIGMIEKTWPPEYLSKAKMKHFNLMQLSGGLSNSGGSDFSEDFWQEARLAYLEHPDNLKGFAAQLERYVYKETQAGGRRYQKKGHGRKIPMEVLEINHGLDCSTQDESEYRNIINEIKKLPAKQAKALIAEACGYTEEEHAKSEGVSDRQVRRRKKAGREKLSERNVYE